MAKIKLNINNLKTISREQSNLKQLTTKIHESFVQLTDSSTRPTKSTKNSNFTSPSTKSIYREFEKPKNKQPKTRATAKKTTPSGIFSIFGKSLKLQISILLSAIYAWIATRGRINVVRFGTFVIFGLLILHLANLQIFNYYASANNTIDPGSGVVRRSII